MTPPPADGRPVSGPAIGALLLGLAVVVVGAFLPWVWSGASSRSSFAVARSADRLGIVDGGVGLLILRAWYLVPLLAAGVVVLVTFHRVRAAAAVAVLLAVVVAVVAVLVLLVAPDPGAGPPTSVVGAAVVVAAAIALRRGRRPAAAS